MEIIHIVIVIGLCFSLWGLKITYDYIKYQKEIRAIKKELDKEIESIKKETYNNIDYEFGDILSCGNLFVSKINGNFLFISYNPNTKSVVYHGFDMAVIRKKAQKNIDFSNTIKEVKIIPYEKQRKYDATIWGESETLAPTEELKTFDANDN